ncbi:MAG: hypothetical protein DI598_10450 [Pseudopedobacter saltans]|uniref:N-acetylmuramoyl-L-alanine amidase n=1 Tax=Pseudopedobacter saltans TaxID=151895 RepID=A0A2W5F2A0_9SPHI|nr:MAG: hypothetical protein DI598_10450 [Pseudopedobacter saltans]
MWKKVSKYFLIGLLILGITPSHGQDNNSNAHKGTQLKTIIVDPGHGYPDKGTKGKNGSNESDIALAIGTKLAQKLRDSVPDIKVLMTRTDENLPNGLTSPGPANRWRAKFANDNHGDLFVSIHVNDDGRNGVDWHSEVVGHETKVYYTGKGKRKKKHTRLVPIIRRYSTPSGVVGTETYVWAMNNNDGKTQFVRDNNTPSEFAEKDTTADSTEEKYFDSPEAKIAASIRTRKYFEKSLLLGSFIQSNFAAQGRVDRGVRQRDWERIWVLQATAMPSVLVETGYSCNEGEEEYLTSEAGQEQVASAVFRAIVQYKNVLAERASRISSSNNPDSVTGNPN